MARPPVGPAEAVRGDRMRALRKRWGLEQKQIYPDHTQISTVESGAGKLGGQKLLLRYSKVFGVPPEDILQYRAGKLDLEDVVRRSERKPGADYTLPSIEQEEGPEPTPPSAVNWAASDGDLRPFRRRLTEELVRRGRSMDEAESAAEHIVALDPPRSAEEEQEHLQHLIFLSELLLGLRSGTLDGAERERIRAAVAAATGRRSKKKQLLVSPEDLERNVETVIAKVRADQKRKHGGQDPSALSKIRRAAKPH